MEIRLLAKKRLERATRKKSTLSLGEAMTVVSIAILITVLSFDLNMQGTMIMLQSMKEKPEVASEVVRNGMIVNR